MTDRSTISDRPHTTEHLRPVTPPQCTPQRVLSVWAAATVPMAALAWVVAPLLAHSMPGAAALPRALILTLTAGLAWQFALVLIVVRQEQGTLRWSALRRALWLGTPARPKTGQLDKRLWWLTVPLVAAFAAEQLVPFLPHPGDRDFGAFLGSTAGHAVLSHSWGWLTVLLVMMLLNTVLGEELLFRGVLLPRMGAAFGRWDWAVNGLLFAAYHLHTPWAIPATLLDTLTLAYPARRYRSALLGIAVHSAQTVFFVPLVLAVVLS
jgi:membrane protease YdiL (CAAX protease family)